MCDHPGYLGQERGQNMSDRVRVGVVGTSWFADLMHLPNLKSHARAELSAICGRSRTRAEELAAKYAIPHVFTDYREMIAHGNLQALIVVTPDDLHYPITMAALDARLHVLCEKPLALHAAHARAMYEKAEAVGVKHMVFFTYRWLPIYRYVRQLLDQGYLGRCFHCHIRYVGDYGRAGQYGWRFDKQRSNGILGDLGSHMVDLARWYVGDIAQVCGQFTTFVERPGLNGQHLDPANDAALVAVQFVNGAQGMIQVSAVAHVGERGQEQHVVLHGEEGTLEVNFTFAGAEIRGVHGGEKQFRSLTIPDELWGDVDRNNLLDPFLKQSIGTRLFIDAIIEDRPAVPTFYDGYQAQVVIDAAIESQERGQWVTIT
jgi:predicted dehydrogenase